ncbi:hypothetical protein TSTA_105280 [Talaromyces stipitatus ATCC 10500]|uniref:Uncharacterized protein n=1 Tax=Talaromyces stipitatus (strain ATCC 10500 / CBS 375.48 / QM 6759 / NRRL 1006) TaxID=441959 RepID=B8MP77_TALSN|nr:uncharacterized protein TSTA_105280 [Talaromyces stipitatus ATCC 10500]EED14316.1 hypothetical protein TSTA_105280 [Talaromyces stipitatus ATCC 10500]
MQPKLENSTAKQSAASASSTTSSKKFQKKKAATSELSMIIPSSYTIVSDESSDEDDILSTEYHYSNLEAAARVKQEIRQRHETAELIRSYGEIIDSFKSVCRKLSVPKGPVDDHKRAEEIDLFEREMTSVIMSRVSKLIQKQASRPSPASGTLKSSPVPGKKEKIGETVKPRSSVSWSDLGTSSAGTKGCAENLKTSSGDSGKAKSSGAASVKEAKSVDNLNTQVPTDQTSPSKMKTKAAPDSLSKSKSKSQNSDSKQPTGMLQTSSHQISADVKTNNISSPSPCISTVIIF